MDGISADDLALYANGITANTIDAICRKHHTPGTFGAHTLAEAAPSIIARLLDMGAWEHTHRCHLCPLPDGGRCVEGDKYAQNDRHGRIYLDHLLQAKRAAGRGFEVRLNALFAAFQALSDDDYGKCHRAAMGCPACALAQSLFLFRAATPGDCREIRPFMARNPGTSRERRVFFDGLWRLPEKDWPFAMGPDERFVTQIRLEKARAVMELMRGMVGGSWPVVVGPKKKTAAGGKNKKRGRPPYSPKKITNRQAAEAMGVSLGTIKNWNSGKGTPPTGWGNGAILTDPVRFDALRAGVRDDRVKRDFAINDGLQVKGQS